MGLLLRALIWLYRMLVSPLIGPRCRYLPSCSEYASEAIGRHGALKGTVLAGLRLCRCHPWGGSGYDPVPDTVEWRLGAWRRHIHSAWGCGQAVHHRTGTAPAGSDKVP
jgi:putative membrane protein insertion efficiency factor